MKISQKPFGHLSGGEQIDQFTLENNKGLKVVIINYGAIIQNMITPDIKGVMKDIVLGYDSLEEYANDPYYIGAVIGPVAGRIANAKIKLHEEILNVDANAGQHQLHGGTHGLHQKVWEAKTEKNENSAKVILTCKANHGEDGFPGNREFQVTYILNNKNQLMLYFDAQSDADTVINMTSHSYFNLSDLENDDVYNHTMMINSLKTLSLDDELMPNGDFDFVLGKATNFSRGALLGPAIKNLPNGLDHVYVINKEAGAFGITAKAVHKESGRTLDVVCDQPGVILYTSNYFNSSVNGKGGMPLKKHGAFCLETQHFPDAPNQPNFPSILIKVGEKYKSRTQLTFGLTSDHHH